MDPGGQMRLQRGREIIGGPEPLERFYTQHNEKENQEFRKSGRILSGSQEIRKREALANALA
ncbi:MAG: hypothetical protein NTZ46_06490 [Verrucomicrobia bacterium]|nr:hypothetical protein [Verrucomicrobiota bacterium]